MVPDKNTAADIRSGRLADKALYDENFADIHPPLNDHQAAVEAGRCYFCYDAPCVEACPTGIDIPSFIRKITTGNLSGSAKTILDENIFGAMCARVCPTEILCEDACVRHTGEEKPVTIGLLQRHATDHLMASGEQPYKRAPDSGRKVAVVGAGPAGLACAHRLSMLGHGVEVFEAHEKSGGLNEHGIAAYKVADDIAAREVNFITAIGGIDIQHGQTLGKDVTLDKLRQDYDAVFLGLGLGGVRALGVEGDGLNGAQDAVDYIADLRQASDLSTLPVGGRVVVIGGGMTAIDIACQSRRLGASEVTIAYRRGPEHMGASEEEQEFAKVDGVNILHWAAPRRILGDEGSVTGIELERTTLDGNKLSGTGEIFVLPADVVFRAVGQTLVDDYIPAEAGLHLTDGRIVVDEFRQSSLSDVWAGGDCVLGGEDLTVAAVQDGKVAAHAIDNFLRGGGNNNG